MYQFRQSAAEASTTTQRQCLRIVRGMSQLRAWWRDEEIEEREKISHKAGVGHQLLQASRPAADAVETRPRYSDVKGAITITIKHAIG